MGTPKNMFIANFNRSKGHPVRHTDFFKPQSAPSFRKERKDFKTDFGTVECLFSGLLVLFFTN
jgi:hypothetical protein